MLALYLAICASILWQRSTAQSNVFCHVVVGDTAAHDQSTWSNDITLAHDAGIDAFALNIAYPPDPSQIANAFAAAESLSNGFSLFFSFDYLGGSGGAWPATGDVSVVSYLQQYAKSPVYYKYQGDPFVSTFEGSQSSNDWAQGGAIRSAIGSLYFVPDWTSVGTDGIGSHLDVIDGFFSWDMWPEGPNNITDDADKQWQSAVSPKSYMLGISPWFFHSASGGTKWVWRGDDMWHDRWSQAAQLKPEFVEIVSWNDYGEAHYIGPINSDSEIPAGSSIYVDGMPHDSWRDFLPFYIAQFKGNDFDISKDQMQYWYRLSPATGGSTCGVNGNDVDYQPSVDPNTIVEDAVFFSALLTSPATVTVQIGSNPATSYDGEQGLNHWSQSFNGQTGAVVFSIVRDGSTINSGRGPEIASQTSLSNGCINYNAWVGSF